DGQIASMVRILMEGLRLRRCAAGGDQRRDAARQRPGVRKHSAVHRAEIRIRADEPETAGNANSDPHNLLVGLDHDLSICTSLRKRRPAGRMPRRVALADMWKPAKLPGGGSPRSGAY